MMRLRIGAIQHAALEMYVTDPAHDLAPGILRVKDGTLIIEDAPAAWRLLVDAANSCTDVLPPHDPECWRALTALAARVSRAL
jgi:hypothetical protein